MGANCCITAPFWCDYGYNIELGENFYSNHNLVILDCGKVTFGDNVFVAPDCGFHTAGHPIDYERRNQGLEYAYGLIINTKIKTQCTPKNVLELVGSPAVLFLIG